MCYFTPCLSSLSCDKTLCHFMVNLKQIFGNQLVNQTRLSTHIFAASQVQVISMVKIWECHLFTKMVKLKLSLKE